MRRVTAVVLWMGLCGLVDGSAQEAAWGVGPPQQSHSLDPNDTPHGRQPDPGQARMQEQAAKARNDERQRKLVSDTAKLYDLAEQLKQQVAKTDKDTLSVDVVKKAEEIERLAKSVKERMRG